MWVQYPVQDPNSWLGTKHHNRDTSNEWDQLSSTTKSAAEANMESSVLGQEHHHTHFEQKQPR